MKVMRLLCYETTMRLVYDPQHTYAYGTRVIVLRLCHTHRELLARIPHGPRLCAFSTHERKCSEYLFIDRTALALSVWLTRSLISHAFVLSAIAGPIPSPLPLPVLRERIDALVPFC